MHPLKTIKSKWSYLGLNLDKLKIKKLNRMMTENLRKMDKTLSRLLMKKKTKVRAHKKRKNQSKIKNQRMIRLWIKFL